MFAITVIVSIVYAAVLAFSAYSKATGQQQVVDSLVHVGVPRERVSLLAVPLGLGALGLIIGLFWAPLGIIAAVGLVLYFIGAVGAHLRVKDTKNVVAPAVLLVVAVVELVLRSTTA